MPLPPENFRVLEKTMSLPPGNFHGPMEKSRKSHKRYLHGFFQGVWNFPVPHGEKKQRGLLISLSTWGAPHVQWPEISFYQGDFSVPDVFLQIYNLSVLLVLLPQ